MSDPVRSPGASSFAQTDGQFSHPEGNLWIDRRDHSQGLPAQFENLISVSDLTLKFNNGTEFKAHKLVICAHSEYFAHLYQTSDWARSRQAYFHLDDDHPWAMEAMLKFIYTFNYDSLASGRPDGVSPILFNIGLYQVATKYGVPELKKATKKKVESMLELAWNSTEFLDAIHEVYTRSPSDCADFRRLLVKISLRHISHLANVDEFQVLLDEIEGFAADIAREGHIDVRSMRCLQQFERLSITGSPVAFDG